MKVLQTYPCSMPMLPVGCCVTPVVQPLRRGTSPHLGLDVHIDLHLELPLRQLGQRELLLRDIIVGVLLASHLQADQLDVLSPCAGTQASLCWFTP